MWNKKQFILALLTYIVSSLFLSVQPISAAEYEPIPASVLEQHLDDFLGGQAIGYLVWQYSGDAPGASGQVFGNDPHSFFRNTPQGDAICEVLKEASTTYPNKFVGVNMWDVGKFPQGTMEDHFRYLHNDCGVTVIRIFAKEGEAGGMAAALAAAQAVSPDLKLLIVIGDMANGGGGIPGVFGDIPVTQMQQNLRNFFNSGYSEHRALASQVMSATQNHPNLYGYEVANEPHCAGDPSLIPLYSQWANTVAGILRGGSNNVGIGQKASEDTTRCDSPGPGDFVTTNQGSNLTIASGHYYHQAELDKVKEALSNSPLPFYIGEAGWDGTVDEEEQEKDPYYLYPIKTVEEKKGPDLIRAELVLQGYQARCTVPKKVAYVKDDFDEYWENFANQLFTLFPEFTFDYTQSEVPLWRNSAVPITDLSNRESLEGYWSHRSTSEQGSGGNALVQDPKSAPIYNLTSPKEQCFLQTDILRAIDQKCAELDEPEKCALDIQIPKTTLKARQLYQLYQNSGLDCDTIAYEPRDKWPTSLSEDNRETLANGLHHTPLYMPRAYRLGFVVFYTQMRDEGPTATFRFLSRFFPEAGHDSHDARVIAFKIPDTVTNKHDLEVDPYQLQDPNLDDGERAELASLVGSRDETSYKDALQWTAEILRSLFNQKQELEQQLEKKIAYTTEGAAGLGPTGLINCLTPYCNENPTVRALIDFANTRVEDPENCELPAEELPAEPVDQITSEGQLTYDEEQPESLENTLAADGVAQKPGAGFDDEVATDTDTETAAAGPISNNLPPFKFLSEYVMSEDRAGRSMEFKGVVIYPQGYELEYLEQALAGILFRHDQTKIDQLYNDKEWQEEHNVKPYFELKNTGQDFPQQSIERIVDWDQECIARVNAGLVADIDQGSETAEGEAEETDTETASSTGGDYSQCAIKKRIFTQAEPAGTFQEEPRIAGGILGFLTRTMQLAGRSFFDPNYTPLSECKTTEQFLLGQCGGGQKQTAAKDTPSSNKNLPQSCAAKYDDVKITVYDEKETFRRIYQIAQEYSIDPVLLYGIFRIESGSGRDKGYRNTMYSLAPGETKQINCADTINSCGAMGPMAWVDGICATPACGAYERIKDLEKTNDICSLEGAVSAAAQKLRSDLALVDGNIYWAAGRYLGVVNLAEVGSDDASIGPKCEGVIKPSGCGGMNYCQCAVEGFDTDFYALKAELGL